MTVKGAELPLSSWWAILIGGPHATEEGKPLAVVASGRLEDPPVIVEVYRCPCCEQRTVLPAGNEDYRHDVLAEPWPYAMARADRKLSVVTYVALGESDFEAAGVNQLRAARIVDDSAWTQDPSQPKVIL